MHQHGRERTDDAIRRSEPHHHGFVLMIALCHVDVLSQAPLARRRS
jgi:hypothetical protein